ncbi:MAG TPA: hypothetical protein VFU69_11095, partial [Ktedonobacterales bacterium]|nr:hypothetical protein [Ktedonobacterales bacterium]
APRRPSLPAAAAQCAPYLLSLPRQPAPCSTGLLGPQRRSARQEAGKAQLRIQLMARVPTAA